MALFRALESLRPAGERLCSDPDAALFLSGWRRSLYRWAALTGGRRLAEALLDGFAPGARAAGIARTKWLDEQASQALRECGQLVLLGAGFDMRAWRLPAAECARVFELDHPETSAAKQAALGALVPPRAGRVSYAAIDFNRKPLAGRQAASGGPARSTESATRSSPVTGGALGGTLFEAGFERSRPACWIWEGVTNYLAPEAVDATLRQIREASDRGVLLVTYLDRAVLDHPERFRGAEKLMARLRGYGEPWTFGLDPGETRAYFAARGFEVVSDLAAAEVWRSAGRSGRAARGYEFYRLASARMG